MTEYLKEKDGWGDGYQSSMGQTLIQLMADVTDHLHYMLERRTNENYLETAVLRSSIISRASELGYRYRRAKANVGTIRISTKDVEIDEEWFAVMVDSDITIPRFTELTFDGMRYYTLETATIPSGDNHVFVRVIQGELVEFERELSPENDLLITDYELIDERSMIIAEGGELYYDVMYDNDNVNRRALSFSNPDDAFYDIKYSIEGLRIVFGDGVFGKLPTEPVRVQYVQVDQEESVVATGREFVIQGGVLTDVNGMSYEVVAYNTEAIRGYQPPEDDASIKRNAGLYHKSNGRGVTNDDYSYWTKRSNLANIVDAKAFGEQELETLMFNLNNVYITYLKENGEDFTVEEHRDVRSFMNKIKTSQAHLIFKNAEKLFMQVLLAFKKHPDTPITDSEAYDIVNRFLHNYFALTEGAIGRGVQASDIICDLYKESVVRNGITYPVIDYAKINLDGMIPFTYKPKTTKAFVRLIDPIIENDRNFVLIAGGLINQVITNGDDSTTDILTHMRDEILRNTPFNARVIANGVSYDAYGNPLPIEINPVMGSTMLIGVDTSYSNPDNVIEGAAVGSTLAAIKMISPEFTVQHFYYSSKAGRRPMIPMRNGTIVKFQSPSDISGVNVYTRLDKDDPSTETLLTTLQPNDFFEQTFTGVHTLQFEYLSDSSEDHIAEIEYPDFDGTGLGIEISSKDGFIPFELVITSGDYSDFVDVDYVIQLPIGTRDFSGRTNNVHPLSVRITDMLERTLFADNGRGYIMNMTSNTISVKGRIDYITGELVLPESLDEGNYMVFFDQNEFNNFDVDSNTVIQLLPPKQNLTSEHDGLSKIRLA